ncbi:MAG: hypothetical protein M3O46_19815, partial [Myxococcota bacterium]|nr:hypothetical protein [Myxococcota bacterium]
MAQDATWHRGTWEDRLLADMSAWCERAQADLPRMAASVALELVKRGARAACAEVTAALRELRERASARTRARETLD